MTTPAPSVVEAQVDERLRSVPIYLLTGEYPPLVGGIADYTHRLAEAVGEIGLDVRVLLGKEHPGSSGSNVNSPRVERLGASLRSWRLLPAVARHIGRGPSVVHIEYQTAAFGMHPAINLLPAWLRRVRPEARVVVTCHDVRLPYLFPKAGPVRGWITRAMIDGAHAATFADRADRDWAGGRPNHVQVPIGSGVPIHHLDPSDRAALRARLAGGDNFLLGYFGFLNATKGLDTLLESLAQVVQSGRRVRLLFVGEALGHADETNAGVRQAVDAAILAHGLANNIGRTGPLTLTEVSDTLQACDALVFPFDDGASFRRSSLAAGLAHGCPIVTTLRPDGKNGVPGFEDGQQVLLVPPANVDALANALERIQDDPVLRRSLGARAREAAQAIEWSAIGRAITGVYARALGLESSS